MPESGMKGDGIIDERQRDSLVEKIREQVRSEGLRELQGHVSEMRPCDREREKLPLFSDSSLILEFLSAVTDVDDEMLRGFLLELYKDEEFFVLIQSGLDVLDGMAYAGEVRFMASLLYPVVRALRPKMVLETGVASGKSSLYILKALHDNGGGQLHSVDKACETGRFQADEFRVDLPENRQPGWLVPDALRDRWVLHEGESASALPALLPQLTPLQLFFHDSLHTYENMMFEFESVYQYMDDGGVFLADNVDVNHAYADFILGNDMRPCYLREWGGGRKRCQAS